MIRKITPMLAVICLFLTSCTTDVEINDPALQAKIDGELFRSTIKKAVIFEDGTLVISGSTDNQSISFSVVSTNKGTYKTAQQAINKASFQDNNSIEFVSKEGETDGTVEITEISNNEISGNFHFKDLKDENGNSLNFSNGWFYRLPLENASKLEEITEAVNECLLNASLTAMVDGVEMITDDHSADIFGVDDSSILIKATNSTQEITIIFSSDVTPGTYSLTGSGDYSASYSLNNDKSSVLSGSLTITDHSLETKCISGSFEFDTRSGVTISGGTFDFGY
ncbi:DUF6252 family protein [Aquimarina sp. 2201CG1-2-11]|uniref:DUF6252 family protein n=1 Tax=Aquimarina discodermiae TaxID=3231043 RepID=UPI003461805F